MNKDILSYIIKKYEPIQNYWELYWLVDKIERINPNVILEIGVKTGGTLALWDYILKNKYDPILICIDIANKLKWDTRKSKNNIKFLIADSRNERTINKVKYNLQNRKIDFLYIDGGHSFYQVISDYKIYSKFVRKGGIIAIHDIFNDTCPGVKQFWNNVKGRKEFCICKQGTGIIRKE